MKKMFLFCGILVSFLASEAQTTKSHTKKTKKTHIDKEVLMQARLDSMQALRQQRIDSTLAQELRSDSARKENERLADEKFQQERMVWNENKTREIDSMNKEMGKTLSKDHEQSLAIQKQRSAINKTAKLNDYQGQQVNYINQVYFGKAQVIKQDPSLAEDQKKQQLAKLNDERRSRLKTVIGKSKEKKFENARKAHNNSNDTDIQWINEVEGVVKN